MAKELKKGDRIIYSKTFTKEEVAYFGKTMGFMGRHHEIANDQDQLLNQGLLTAILTNRIGGEYNILMYRMEFDFLKKVWTGEEMTVINDVTSIVEKKSRQHIEIESNIYNESDELVLKAILKGILLDI